jgi:outer membrane protein
MSRLITRVLFAALCLPIIGMAQTSTPAPAAQPFVASPVKLAWIDLEGAILSCDQGKKDFGELQKYLDSKKAEMDALRKEVDDLQIKHDAQASKLTDEARTDLEDQIEARNTSLQRFKEDAQKDVDSRRSRVGNAIGRKLMPVIDKYAKEKGLSAVLIFSQGRDAYVDQSLNITEEIVKAFNQAIAAGAAKAPETPAAKKP